MLLGRRAVLCCMNPAVFLALLPGEPPVSSPVCVPCPHRQKQYYEESAAMLHSAVTWLHVAACSYLNKNQLKVNKKMQLPMCCWQYRISTSVIMGRSIR